MRRAMTRGSVNPGIHVEDTPRPPGAFGSMDLDDPTPATFRLVVIMVVEAVWIDVFQIRPYGVEAVFPIGSGIVSPVPVGERRRATRPMTLGGGRRGARQCGRPWTKESQLRRSAELSSGTFTSGIPTPRRLLEP